VLAVYSAGLGVPFLLSAVAFSGGDALVPVPQSPLASRGRGPAGAVLIAMGALVLTGELFRLNMEI
jgi:cytochrome c-type biogenesis protein